MTTRLVVHNANRIAPAIRCRLEAQIKKRPGGGREPTGNPGLTDWIGVGCRAQYYPASGHRTCLSGGRLMAISRSLRFQILRRDGHCCRYCGEHASEQVKLVVDHVVPTAHGGTDDPGNLAAACSPCNMGKAATTADQAMVAQVAEDAIRWGQAVKASALVFSVERELVRKYFDAVDEYWSGWHYGFKKLPIPRPTNWEDSIEKFYERGMPIHLLLDCARIALNRNTIPADDMWRYFMGCAWRRMGEIEDVAREAFEIQTRQADE
jgi:hypothetical protein